MLPDKARFEFMRTPDLRRWRTNILGWFSPLSIPLIGTSDYKEELHDSKMFQQIFRFCNLGIFLK
jgi:hypothetical protein